MGWVRPNRPPRAFPAHRCYSLRIHPRRHHLYPRLIKNFRRMVAGMRHVLSRLSKCMAHKVFPFPIRCPEIFTRGTWPLSAQVATNEEKRTRGGVRTFSRLSSSSSSSIGFFRWFIEVGGWAGIWGLLWRFWTV